MENMTLELPQQSRLQLQEFLGHLPIGVAWASVPDGRIRFVNDRFTAMFGYSLAELSTVHDWIMRSYARPEQATAVDGFWYERSDTVDAAGSREIGEIELDIRCKDGSIKTVLSSKILLPQQSGALSLFLDITPRTQREKKVRQLAMEDSLTGLLNRRGFEEQLREDLEHSRRSDALMALLLLDLDRFKPVNDTLGHEAGDRLLQVVAQRLRSCLREDDSACRLGGDEFAVLITGMHQENTAWLLADRIMQALARPVDLDGQRVSTACSIGIAVFPQDGTDLQTLLRHADEAMYRVKRNKQSSSATPADRGAEDH